jgi:NAD(P)-dependent dehydrogenase (short-subunit alcohol dehydrogenase family)
LENLLSTVQFKFTGKIAVVTATSGIGLGIALALRDAGAQVIAAGLAPSDMATLQGLEYRALDVTDPASISTLFDSLTQLDILVNAAGIIRRAAEHDPDVFEQVIAVNLNGSMRCCQAAKALLLQSRGCVVNIASMLSFFGGAHAPGYSASKGGVAQLTKSLANAWAAQGVRVNAVAPGYIATALTQPLQDDPAKNEPIVARTPMGRWGTPQDVAGPVLFLCSDAAAFVTGAILPVDGGYLVY